MKMLKNLNNEFFQNFWHFFQLTGFSGLQLKEQSQKHFQSEILLRLKYWC